MGSKLIIPDESLELQKLVASSMSRFTFGIVQPSDYGVENQELATGVGVEWNGMHLILTAAHVVAHCPEQTLRFFLPTKNIEFAQSSGPRAPAEIRTLLELAKPMTPIFSEDLDLAVIKLAVQTGATGCFIPLRSTDVSPKDGTEVGVFGYPSAAKIPWDANFIASPLHFFGKLDAQGKACSHPPAQDFTVPYGMPDSAKGFSGSGVWYWPAEPVWVPEPRLMGIIATHCRPHDVLSGYNIESIMAFLKEEGDLLTD